MMGRTLVCLRHLLICGAIVIAISGIAESICASYYIYQLHEYAHLTPENVYGPPLTLVVTGLITCLVGWCAWQFLDFTNRGQVAIFALALTAITIVEVSAGICVLIKHEEADTLPPEHLENVFALAITDEKHLWDRMQSKLHCCGINGPADYREQDAVPWSCCDTSKILDTEDAKGLCTSMYGRGCQHVVMNRTKSILLRIFLLALGTVLMQVCFIVCMSCYTKACKERVKRRKELMAVAQTYTQASRDPETKDNLLNRQPRYPKTPTDTQA